MTIKLIVELREDGKVYVSGPLDKRDLCLAMLDEAKGAVKNWKKTHIVIPNVKTIK